ncbi:MAG: hypothetical protein FJX23_07600, partial [Alphaproteobacteria bacterium]|nr:hypothetical protein [Alphaproteobacteria bacterium]
MKPIFTQFLNDFPLFFDEKSTKNAQKNPHSCDDWNALGCEAFEAGNYPTALKFFSDAIHLSDQYHHYIHYECAAVYILRAKWHMEHENWDAAKADLAAAIFQDHGAPQALALRIWIAEHIDNNPQESAKFTQQLSRFAPDYLVPARWREVGDYSGMLADDSAWQTAIRHK